MVQELARKIIGQAVEVNAQDIYMIPRADNYELYMRIGDERRFIDEFESQQMMALISHFKFVAGMNVGEKRRSQLGSCDYAFADGEEISLRLSSVGDYRGKESLVVRLLYSGRHDLNYWFNGMRNLLEVIGGRGLYLFSGPVGSGKTTLMHQLVAEKFPDKQIISIEDPVEIKQDSMLQLQLNESIGMTYDNLIKLSLRHRPDILIIGEIRDSETARAVLRASLTGTMVFSTIHAKSIAGVYARLLELGVSHQELVNSLRLIAYQRLIGGGGVIDFADSDFQNHQPDKWNEQIESLARDGHITAAQAKIEKIAA
ncbi:competence protein ComGA [Streptococcus henryi]|uniref:Competence protein ComGA n=1 Tax=Streptococcus henryi TaxID=439219 RepID=A0A1G6BSP3_9STRE|nr:competence type IV pilus ATPase ComGA [Streptococcus henryi]SDB23628.1 competence protein ComGA [Streptococcus henryi]